MKIIFLDIDGVLNSVDWQPRRPKAKATTYELAAWMRMIDPAAVARLQRVVDATGARVVVSSSWRTMLTLWEIQACLAEGGFRGELLGVTPDLSQAHAGSPIVTAPARWVEIAHWLEQAHYFGGDQGGRRGVESYVILDDDDVLGCDVPGYVEGGRLMTHVRTDFRVGLTDADADRAVAILTGPEVTA